MANAFATKIVFGRKKWACAINLIWSHENKTFSDEITFGPKKWHFATKLCCHKKIWSQKNIILIVNPHSLSFVTKKQHSFPLLNSSLRKQTQHHHRPPPQFHLITNTTNNNRDEQEPLVWHCRRWHVLRWYYKYIDFLNFCY